MTLVNMFGLPAREPGRLSVADMVVVTASAACALVVVSLHQAYSFTRGQQVTESELFYGCERAENDGCLTKPIPAPDYNPSRPPTCQTHDLPMNRPMVKTPRR